MSQIVKFLQSLVMPAVLIIWVTCGVIWVCQYKGILPWFDDIIEIPIILATIIPPVIVILYGLRDIVKSF